MTYDDQADINWSAATNLVTFNNSYPSRAPSIPGFSGVFGNKAAYTLTDVATALLNLSNFDVVIGSLAGGGTTGGIAKLGTGNLNTDGNNNFNLDLNPAFLLTVGDIFNLASGQGTTTPISGGLESLNGATTLLGEGYSFLLNGSTFQVTCLAEGNLFNGGNDFAWRVTQVGPEPGRAPLLLAGLPLLMRRRRKNGA